MSVEPLDASAAETWAQAKRAAAPAFLIDVSLRRLCDANEAGVMLWFGIAKQARLPLEIDAATPALSALQHAEERLQHIRLCFWTPRGTLARRMRCMRKGTVVVLVCVGEDQRQTRREQAQTPVQEHCAESARLAHELRTPIAAVAAYAEILEGEHFGPLGTERYRHYAGNIREGALHALGVIESMLGARAASGSRKELHFRDIDPTEVIRRCFAVMRPIAEAAAIKLDVRLAECLPRIIADEVSLRQMLLNLLTNAVKFARPGDRVTLGVSYGDDGVLSFAVEDTGPGMSDRRHGADVFATGLGLGLPLTRELAAANGAALEIESAPGKGTRARISFGHTRVVM